ncbi:BnaA02g19490D [Brassica napus]|uniref:BnaA02g19490D protein n=1 Tax=Brassica napus TaxID=3708 RepID=A0A078IUX5_BRANA|nr:BnaA02g19490D [Brassica napus]
MDQLDLIHALEPKRGRDTNPLVKPPQNFAGRKVINGGSNRHVPPETHRKQEPGIRDTTNDERNLAQHRQNRSSPEALKPPETKRKIDDIMNLKAQKHRSGKKKTNPRLTRSKAGRNHRRGRWIARVKSRRPHPEKG